MKEKTDLASVKSVAVSAHDGLPQNENVPCRYSASVHEHRFRAGGKRRHRAACGYYEKQCGFQKLAAVGRFFVENYDEYQVSMALEDYINYDGFGEQMAEEHEGEFISSGFVYYFRQLHQHNLHCLQPCSY